MKLKEIEIPKIKMFLDGKVVGYVKKFEVCIDVDDLSCIRARLTQTIPSGGGVFGGNIVEKVTDCILRSWKSHVIRLRTEGMAPEAIEEPEDEDADETAPAT